MTVRRTHVLRTPKIMIARKMRVLRMAQIQCFVCRMHKSRAGKQSTVTAKPRTNMAPHAFLQH
jgi:hypothetical protein